MLPLLTIFSCLMGVWGGYVIAVNYYGMPPNTFIDPLPLHITLFDFISGMFKAVAFGFIIVTIACYKGVGTRGGAAGVGKATTSSVVICYSIILISNFLITIALNTSHDFVVEFFSKFGWNLWLKSEIYGKAMENYKF